MSPRLDCPVCGYGFDPAEQAACLACPLRGGCPLVCCPACGHVTVDAGRSRLARLAAPLLHRETARSRPSCRSLADVPAGEAAEVTGFAAELNGGRREQLQAYGLAPGRLVAVVQQRPVTVACVDQTEIALESDIAELIEVGPAPQDGEPAEPTFPPLS